MVDRSFVSRVAACGALMVALAACGGDSGTGTDQVATSIQVVTPPATNVAAGQPLVTPPTFVVRDQSGDAMSNVAVMVSLIAGGGTLTDAPARTVAGATIVGNWTLGQTVGTNQVEIRVANVKPETLTAVSVAGVPTSIAVLNNDQSAFAGRTTVNPVRFQLRDQFGNGVPSRQLTMSVVAGGGSLAGVAAGATVTVTTGADGAATAPAWTLGRTAKPQRLLATLVGGTLADSARASITSSFDLDVRFVGGTPSAAVQQAFLDAAARLRAVITGDVADVQATSLNIASNCGMPGAPTAMSETIDDVVIFAQVKPIDGVGNILGQAGACFARTSAGLLGPTTIGIMSFDEADMASMVTNGRITDVVTHEMLHVLGFSVEFFANRSIISGRGTATTAFTGSNGARGCREAGAISTCATTVPLENMGGGGTADSHWRETTFDTELMTGFINGPARPFSGMTIGALQDLGYTVNADAKDAYTTASALFAADRPLLSTQPAAAWEEVLPVRFVITREGRVQRRVLEALP